MNKAQNHVWIDGKRYTRDIEYLVFPVKHHKRGRIYFFAPTAFVPQVGDVVLCETAKGLQKGTIVGDARWEQCTLIEPETPPRNIVKLLERK